MHDAMQNISGMSQETSNQHKDISIVWQTWDGNDTFDIIKYLSQRNPFKDTPSIFNIANGTSAQEGMNVKGQETSEKTLWQRWSESGDDYTCPSC